MMRSPHKPREADPRDNNEIEKGGTVDVGAGDPIVGLRVLDASKRLRPSDLASITIERPPLVVTTP